MAVKIEIETNWFTGNEIVEPEPYDMHCPQAGIGKLNWRIEWCDRNIANPDQKKCINRERCKPTPVKRSVKTRAEEEAHNILVVAAISKAIKKSPTGKIDRAAIAAEFDIHVDKVSKLRYRAIQKKRPR